MEWPAAAERDERQAARVHAALHTHPTQRTRHDGIGGRDDGFRSALDAHAEWRGYGGDGRRSLLATDAHAAAPFTGGDGAEHDVRVGHGGAQAAAVVRRGAGRSARALGAGA